MGCHETYIPKKKFVNFLKNYFVIFDLPRKAQSVGQNKGSV